jgi:hypothetical protein
MIKRSVTLLSAVYIFYFLMTGCDPADRIILINDTSEKINVTILSTISRSEESFELLPEEEKPVIIFGLIHTDNLQRMKKIINRHELIKSVRINDKIFTETEIKQIVIENMTLKSNRWIIKMSCFIK